MPLSRLIKLFFAVITILTSARLIESGKCPSAESLYPCECYNDNIIRCSGSTGFSLTSVFEKASKSMKDEDKKFDEFMLINNHVHEFERNVFHGITFKNVIIRGTNLSHIHTNAFDDSKHGVEHFEYWTRSYKLTHDPPVHDLWKALNSLTNLKSIHIHSEKITTIPENAFSLTQSHLENITIKGNTMKEIGDNAFIGLDNLAFVVPGTPGGAIAGNAIYFNNHAFDLRKTTSQVLTIDLHFSNVRDWSFDEEGGVFLGSKRPVHIDVTKTLLEHLPEKVFLPFLKLDERNKIKCGRETHLKCTDCKNYWILKEKMSHQVEAYCSNGRSVFENEDQFGHCK